uniref:M10 family metallopeptidase C-terminal domain-containing protein n=1 Tax=Brevundimonas sp. TaxID=1871086 RepID=UPI0037846129
MPTLTGTAGDDNLTGGEGDDVITGLGGDDVLIGAGGDDVLSGGSGRNYLDGGPGNDTVSYLDATNAVTVSLAVSGFQNTGYSTDQLVSINRLIGSSYADTLTGSAGDDYLDPGSRFLTFVPADTVTNYHLSNVNDVVSGGDGNDQIVAEGVTNGSVFNGDAGDDVITVGYSGVSSTFESNRRVVAQDGLAVRINGDAGADTLTARSHAVIDGGDGDDLITVGIGIINTFDTRAQIYIVPTGTDTTVRLTGGAGADTFAIWNPVGTAVVTDFNVANDRLDLSQSTTVGTGTSYSRVYVAQQGADTVFYSSVNPDLIYGRLLNVAASSIPTSAYMNNGPVSSAPQGIVDTTVIGIYGTTGDDTLSGATRIYGGAGNDTITGTADSSTLNGGDGDDVLRGGAGADTLKGDNGNDTLGGGLGSDTLIGGAGIDFADYSDASGSVTVNLATGSATGAAGTDILNGIEGVIGSDFADALIGGAGADILRGGRGLDQLTGGAGADRFVFAAGDSTGSAIDSIADFQTGVDTLVIEGAVTTVSTVRTNGGGTVVFIGRGSGEQDVIGVNGTIQGADFRDPQNNQFRVNMAGSDLSDVLIGTDQGDTMSGGVGDDFLTGSRGSDTLYGGSGRDQFIYVNTTDSNRINRNLGVDVGDYDLITDFETGIDSINLTTLVPSSIVITTFSGFNPPFGSVAVYGSYVNAWFGPQNNSPELFIQVEGWVQRASDILVGGRTNIPFTIYGAYLADTLIGSEANDLLIGGGGADALAGGEAADTFVYNAVSESNVTAYDNLYDFQTGIDKIYLRPLNATSISIIRTDNGSSFVFAQTPGGDFQLAADRR